MDNQKKVEKYADCARCGNSFLVTRVGRKYCSETCRVNASMEKKGSKIIYVSAEEYSMIMRLRDERENPVPDNSNSLKPPVKIKKRRSKDVLGNTSR